MPPRTNQPTAEPTDRQLHNYYRRQCCVCLCRLLPDGEANCLAHYHLLTCVGECSEVARRFYKDCSRSRRGKFRTAKQLLAVLRQRRAGRQPQPEDEDEQAD
jgi:hypothetical protein